MRIWMVGCLWLWGSLCAATVAVAADVHVSPAGDDQRGDGSPGAPYRTLGFVLDPAAQRVREGDRLILQAPPGNAVFRESEVRLRHRLTLMAAPGAAPRIECPLDIPDGVCIQIDPEASGSRLSGLDISGGQLYGVFLQTAWDARDAPNARGARDVVIEHSRIHHTGRDAIKVTPKSNGLRVSHVEIHHTGQIYPPGTPLEERNAEGIDNVGGDGMVVQDSHIHDTATTGLYFKGGAQGVVIERNRIERTGEAGILVGFDTSPEFFDTRVNPAYFEALGAIVRNNVVRDTDYAGIGLYASQGSLVAHNTLIDTARLGHAALYFGVTLQDFDPAAGRPANRANRVVHNLILQTGSGEHACGAIRYSQDLGGLAGLDGAAGLAGNLYHRTAGPCIFRDGRPGSPLEDGGGFGMWQSALGSEVGSEERAYRLDTAGQLPTGSPAIDRVDRLPEVLDDLNGAPRGVRADVGALEFQVATGNTPRLISGALSGSWFDPARAGEGMLLEVGVVGGQRQLVVSWYTYRDGAPLWLFGSTQLTADARTATVNLLEARGARFGAQFDPAAVQFLFWGELELAWSGCAQLDFRYRPRVESAGQGSLTRLLDLIEGLPCVP